MANYKEGVLAGSKYNRARIVTFNNALNGNPNVNIIEEEVINLNTGEPTYDSVLFPGVPLPTTLVRDIGQLFEAFDATKTFPKFDPVTGELSTTETMTHQDLFLWMHGLYLSLAYVRDNPPIQEVPAP